MSRISANKLSTGAARAALYRARRDLGLGVYSIEINTEDLLDALNCEGRLVRDSEPSKTKVQQALQRWVKEVIYKAVTRDSNF